jgi:putative ABC transport system permease protein
MPREFEFPAGTEYWKPLAISASHRTWTTGRTWAVLARLRPGVSIGQADAEMNAIAARIATEHPDTNEAIGVRILRLGEMTNKPTSRFVLIGLGASLFVLLLACVNVSNLLLARATTRQHEVAVRAAMGANRVSIARLFVTEGLVLSAVGAVLGALLAAWGQRLTRAAIPAQAYRWVPGLRNLRIDGTVLAAAAVIALASGLACGLVAAWRATRAVALTAGLAESGRGRVSGHGRLRQLLVVAEVALALVLLVASGVMVRTYSRMAAFDIGINPKNVVQMHLSLPSNRYPDAASVRSFYDRTLERIEAMPGVTAAAAGNVSGSVAMTDFQIVGQPPPPHGTMPPNLHLVTPGYFAAVGLPVLDGRGFSKEDEATGTTTVAVVSQSVVRRYWKTSGDPLGAMVSRTGYAFPPLRVIGVVGDVKDWFSGSPQPTVYVLNSQMPQSYVQIFVRTAAEPTAMAARLRAEVRAVDRTLPVEELRTMERNLWEQTSGVRISAAQMGVFAIIALLLATTGIYGVVAFSVAQRTREMGVRMALGASAQDVLRLIVGQSMRTTAIGLTIGCLAAVLLMQAMARALFDVVKLDATVFVGVTVGLALCAALAAYAPARRAAKVDPMVALRCE